MNTRMAKPSTHIFILIIIFLISNLTVLTASNPQDSEIDPVDPSETKILINEVMYNPSLDDDYYEWVELYNPTPSHINVSGWIIRDNNADDYITGDDTHGNSTTIIPPYGYAILTDNDTKVYDAYDIPDETIKLRVNTRAIGNGLGNNGDKLILIDNTGVIIDAIEWVIDYMDVPGYPASNIPEGHTLSRRLYTDTDNTSNDFYDEPDPTIGRENHYNNTPLPRVYLLYHPEYIPKTTKDNIYSIPTHIKLAVENLNPYSNIEIKAYIVSDPSHIYPASQLYYNNTWQYSYYYQKARTDQNGCYIEWLHLRFNSEYQEYQNHIKNNNTAYIIVKVKTNHVTYTLTEEVKLLDLDESTSNGTTGGYIVGVAQRNTTILEDTLTIVRRQDQRIISISFTEDNHIEEGFITEPGYYKIPSPTGPNYTLQFISPEGVIIHEKNNITVNKGSYNVDLNTESTYYNVIKNHELNVKINIKNTGDFNDSFSINVNNKTPRWSAMLSTDNIHLNKNESGEITLRITPYPNDKYGQVSITARSDSDHGVTDKITLNIENLAPDLTVTNIKCTDKENNQRETYGEGSIIKIKATVKNQGSLNATNITVGFYYDKQENTNCIGRVKYESIGKYQKYPSVEWDTSNVKPGVHTIIAVADEENKADEHNETNNIYSCSINIYNTTTPGSEYIKITEVYYHTHPNIKNEYIKIQNPTDKTINISNWYITKNPYKRVDKQARIILPQGTMIKPGGSITATYNASAYLWETGCLPDFEYNTDSMVNVPELIASKNFTMSNKAGVIALKDPWNHTVDMIVYGDINYTDKNWRSTPVKNTGEGAILRRRQINNIPVDTDTYTDWVNNRRYGIGQSDFPAVKIKVDNGSLRCFVSPDSSFNVITDELRKAEKSILLNMYEFTHPNLCDEIIKALERNVSVRILIEGGPVGGIDNREKMILNNINMKGGEIHFMVNKPSLDIYARYAYNHAKYAVIDNETVIIHSCNYAKTGVPQDPSFGNREWGVVIKNNDTARYFTNVFYDDWNPDRHDIFSFKEMNLSLPSDLYYDDSIPIGGYTPCFEPMSYNSSFTVTPILSPDNSMQSVYELIDSAEKSILIEQLYFYKDWKDEDNPLIDKIIEKHEQGVDVKILLNYNPAYSSTNNENLKLKTHLEEHGVQVRFMYTNWSILSNLHNKGVIIDNKSVLISSINWNEESFMRNREVGVIITNNEVATYYGNVFMHDWDLKEQQMKIKNSMNQTSEDDEPDNVNTRKKSAINTDETLREKTNNDDAIPGFKNMVVIVVIYTATALVIARDWRRREWT